MALVIGAIGSIGGTGPGCGGISRRGASGVVGVWAVEVDFRALAPVGVDDPEVRLEADFPLEDVREAALVEAVS